jgi:hypothetical protein
MSETEPAVPDLFRFTKCLVSVRAERRCVPTIALFCSR